MTAIFASFTALPIVGSATNKLVPWLETKIAGNLFTILEIDSVLHGDVFDGTLRHN